MKNRFKIASLVLLSLTLTFCSGDDGDDMTNTDDSTQQGGGDNAGGGNTGNGNDSQNNIHEFSYPTIAPIFHQGGSVRPTTIKWDGETGTFEVTPLNFFISSGFRLDNNTGKISWTKNLGYGTYSFQILAKNSQGTEPVNVKLVNTFQGTFKGDFIYNVNPTTGSVSAIVKEPFSITYKKDGTVAVTLNNKTGSGNWLINNQGSISKIEATITMANGDKILTSSILDYTNDSVDLEGNFYEGFRITANSLRGEYKLKIQ